MLTVEASVCVDTFPEYESLESRDLAVTGRLLSWLILRSLCTGAGDELLEGGGDELCIPLALINAGCMGYIVGALSRSWGRG